MLHEERTEPQESLKLLLQDCNDGTLFHYLVPRKVLHIAQTNTVSLWASGAKESEKEKEHCVKPSSIKHSLQDPHALLIPVAPILDLNTLYEQQREQKLTPQLLQFLWKIQ